MVFVIEERSRLPATAEEVWAHASTMEGVNAELGPWVRMGVPAEARGLRLEEAPLGETAFVSTLFALSVLPFDRHHLRLEVAREGAFVEESWSWLQRRWRHERSVTPCEGGCEVVDRLTVAPRIPGPLTPAIVRALFAWRHRRLRARFGAT